MIKSYKEFEKWVKIEMIRQELTQEACGENGDRLSEDLRSSAWKKDGACIYNPADSGVGRQYGRV